MPLTLAPITLVDPPLTIQDVKDWLAIDHSQHDLMIERLIASVCETIEQATGRPMSVRQYVYAGSPGAFYVRDMVLPRIPLVSVDAVSYTSYAGEPFDLVLDVDYRVVGDRLDFFAGRGFSGSLSITFTAGYEPDTLPEPLHTAALQEVARLYEFRAGVSAGTTAQPVQSPLDALHAFRRVTV